MNLAVENLAGAWQFGVWTGVSLTSMVARCNGHNKVFKKVFAVLWLAFGSSRSCEPSPARVWVVRGGGIGYSYSLKGSASIGSGA